MSKKSNILSAYIIYKLRWLIIIGIIMLVTMFFVIDNDMNEKYKKYGYSSWTQLKYDEWTGEIIPKDEIKTYSSEDKYITNSKGEKIKIRQMKALIKQFGEIQGSYASFKGEKIESIDNICSILLKDYLDLNYEIVKWGNSLNDYVLQIRGDYEQSYYSEISNQAELEGLVKEVVKDRYCKENNIET